MEKRIIISGDPKAVGFIVQENRIRVERGDVKFTDCAPDKKQPDNQEKALQERIGVLEAKEQEIKDHEVEIAEREKALVDGEEQLKIKSEELAAWENALNDREIKLKETLNSRTKKKELEK